MVAHNQFAKRSKFDAEALGKLFKELAPLNLNLRLSGFKTPEIDMLIRGVDLRVGEEAEAPPLVAGPAITRLGELWILRNPAAGLEHRLYIGDALDGASYAALMGAERATAVITDPPFGGAIAGYLPGGKIKHREFVMGSEGRTPDELEQMLEPVCLRLRAAAKPGALVYIFMDWRSIEVLLRVGGVSSANSKT